MQDKLTILLDKLNLPENTRNYFIDGSLEKIICNKNQDKYVFLININEVLPLGVFFDFENLLCKTFSSAKSVEVKFTAPVFDVEKLTDYYRHFMSEYSKNAPLLEMFVNCNLILDDNDLVIEVANKAEEMKFLSIKEELEKKLNYAGFDIKIKLVIDEEKAQEIRNEIENAKTAEIPVIPKKENPIIMGSEIKSKMTDISSLTFEMDNIAVEAKIFGKDLFESSKSDFKIITLKIYDGTDSMYCKIFCRDASDFNNYNKRLKEGNWYKIKGYTKNDKYSNEIVLNARDINVSEKKDEVRTDEAKEKRIELHAHTKMSQMDGICDAKTLVKMAYNWGHRAIAITDHNGVQSFPDVYHAVCDINKKKEGEPFKALYGTELTLIDDTVDIVLRPTDEALLKTTYVVFDFETTGFNAGGADSIIEVGAVKICNGEIVDRFSELINPGRKLPAKITEVTNITDDMLAGKDNEETVIKRFIEWYGNLPMVAHNAKFDVSFLKMAYKKYGFGEFTNTVIDTLELSRTMDNNFARHSLSALVKRYDVPWDENAHHRADYDAEGTALVFHKMLKKLEGMNYEKISDLDKLVSKDEIHKYGNSYHVNLLALNREGLKNLFKIISLANTKYMYKTPRILRSEIENHREGLLVGSGCYESEIFKQARSKSDEELSNLINFYDYVEVQPVSVYDHLIQMNDFGTKAELISHLMKIIRVTKEAGKLVVATGDVHHINPDDRIYREIIVNQKVPGGGRHPLARKNINQIPSQHFRTTDEMLEDFSFLSDEEAREIVITNPNKIADMAEVIEVIIETGGIPFAPKIEHCSEDTIDMVYDKAKAVYGDPLPYLIEERLASELYGNEPFNAIKYELDEEGVSKEEYDKELYSRLHKVMRGYTPAVRELMARVIKKQNPDIEDIDKEIDNKLTAIVGANFDVIYLIAQKLVKKSNDDGYLVGSRGSVGSSLVATMMGISEVNPLPPHYVCPKCQKTIFEKEDGESLGSLYGCGYDMPDMDCPNCGEKMRKEGHDMPFATFLGLHADKVPDIDLNFSDLNQAAAHEYTKVLFGEDNVYRAGTIGTVADKTAFGYVKGYCEDKGIMMRTAEVERLAKGCTGVKRTTGQHPGGIVVIPGYMDVFDFTPFQYPADDVTSAWRTTHFDYHAIDQDVLKLDILGHSGPTKLRLIQDLTGIDVTTIPLDDKDTMEIFNSTKSLGVRPEQILSEVGTLGIPEFGTPFTIGMVKKTRPKTFAELVKISGLSHGTDVWNGNAEDLIDNGIVPFSEVIGCRDDIMVYLMYNGLPAIKAFKIMEFVRKGKASKIPEEWALHKKDLQEAGIDDWYIDSCEKIKYMFPKAHAVAYVINAFRLAYFKVHRPGVYYYSQFSVEYTDFDIEAMIKGYETVKMKMEEISDKGYAATNKESNILESLKLALEALARGIKFAPIDINKSDALSFVLSEDEKTLIPPFRTIDGLGDVVAKNIVAEREKAPFLSIEDLQKRAKISSTLIEKMRMMGILDGMDESSQLSLF
ncbi:MAG: PolC-type DNA polymerase III [Bacilli bacterium]|nr:PolC-type DNA polymerase III [Bacilli bacterium]